MISFFLRLRNIPLCVRVCVERALSIHMSKDSLGCFHVLGIVTSAAVNIEVCVSFQIRVWSGYMPRSGTSWITWQLYF